MTNSILAWPQVFVESDRGQLATGHQQNISANQAGSSSTLSSTKPPTRQNQNSPSRRASGDIKDLYRKVPFAPVGEVVFQSFLDGFEGDFVSGDLVLGKQARFDGLEAGVEQVTEQARQVKHMNLSHAGHVQQREKTLPWQTAGPLLPAFGGLRLRPRFRSFP